jgi:pimeloyl-ACP methyl ester carboxylesterase
MPYQHVNGIEIYYEEKGEGKPLLLIQGLGYPSGMWFLQVPEFSHRFRTIIFDNRGAGRSDKPDEDYSVALMASDAAGLLQALGIKKAHVVGISLGGYIAQELALANPELVDRLVLLATTCGGPEYGEMTKGLWAEVAALAGLPPDEIVRKGMALATALPFARSHPELIERCVTIRLETPQPLYALSRQAMAAYNFNSKDRVHLIRHPTLILAGAQDRVMPLPMTEAMAQKIPNGRIKVYPDAGHLLFMEKALDVNRDIIDFLSGRN